ncbi:glycogen/starch/alpha-glucan phosphorylase [Salinicoccus halodurans]|uniref:Alpha-1,4 glucan phosphorylase n=1 Tax=Salinicoccus halodurans TaxID=407035 RepID=A0A0F7D3T8_9STAP|nr:glycogen/starch/alpha-glucan phosphorylase [Salinicoccus halodurans]AKG73060.1 maltodextrin phosphorylase [Salinicoccus halodurans]SFK78282.1 maltodextrin phosphorylase [Salinicoccus halodurans]
MKSLELKDRIEAQAYDSYGQSFYELHEKEQFVTVGNAVMEYLVPKWIESKKKFSQQKQAYYFSAEFLMGRALSNNLTNLEIEKNVKETLEEMGVNYNILEEAEDDAGLGNGGLGRLAACFLDSGATLDYPMSGYGILYQYGIFKQNFVNGFQVEEADPWLDYENPWLVKNSNDTVIVEFSEADKVEAVPYDMPIVGYGGNTINTLRLWSANAIEKFDFQAFDEGKYIDSVKAQNEAETISRILYPNDSTDEGKQLRLKQQYFFTSASLQDLMRKYKEAGHKSFDDFSKLHSIQLNDTHPALAIPELIRLLEQEGVEFEKAFDITQKTMAFTNHTLLAEALEVWNKDLFLSVLPNLYPYIEEINGRLVSELKEWKVDESKWDKFLIIQNNSIHMAFMSIYASRAVNGVAAIHTDLLKTDVIREWHGIFPNRIVNKTNGITQRRWLLQSNPQLSAMITDLLGSREWITDLSLLKDLEEKYTDDAVLGRFIDIKKEKKQELADYIQFHEEIDIDPESIFDIQIKRLHEYKRQLMMAFYIADLYNRIKADPDGQWTKRTFIFGAKAAPGYYMAKAIIKFINELADRVNADPEVNGIIKVVFVENYGVSYAEKLFPAADVSEQISTAGKEASGTGNMKFMLNGAVTVGTMDGANVEIVEEAGRENNYIFGMEVEEVEAKRGNYDPEIPLQETEGLAAVVESLTDGTYHDNGTGMFQDIYDSLTGGDEYFVLEDFADYRETQDRISHDYRDSKAFYKKGYVNMANAGKFSSDRTLAEYAEEIWHISKFQ